MSLDNKLSPKKDMAVDQELKSSTGFMADSEGVTLIKSLAQTEIELFTMSVQGTTKKIIREGSPHSPSQNRSPHKVLNPNGNSKVVF